MTRDVPALGPHQVKAFSNETRLEMLRLLSGRMVSTPELADEMHKSQSLVNYHLEVLVRSGCVDVAARRKRNGRPTQFYTAKRGALPSSVPRAIAVRERTVSRVDMEELARKAGSALDLRARDDQASTFVVECLTLTAAHRVIANEALRLTVANLRVLHEQCRQLSIATDAPLSRVEMGVALFEPVKGER